MPFQMPEIRQSNALAMISNIRQQRTQNALAERQLALTEGAQRRQDAEFQAQQQTAAQERQRVALADVFNAVEQAKTPERAMQIGASIMQTPEWQSRFGNGGDVLAQRMLSTPEAWAPENIRTAASAYGIRLRSQELADMAAEARVKRAPVRPERRVLQDENRNYVQVDLETGDQTPLGMRAPAPAPPVPVSVTYQAAPQVLVDPATGQQVLGRFNPKTGAYERADVPGGLAPAPRPQAALTEGQSKALIFGSRMREANAVMDRLASQGVASLPLGFKAASEFPLLGSAVNAAAAPEVQMLDQAQRDWLNANLRRESGATILDTEFANGARQYFPQPGDSPTVIEQKRRNRLLAEQGVLAEVPESRRDSVRPVVPPDAPRGGPAAPRIGTVDDGYVFLGGDPKNPRSWRKQ